MNPKIIKQSFFLGIATFCIMAIFEWITHRNYLLDNSEILTTYIIGSNTFKAISLVPVLFIILLIVVIKKTSVIKKTFFVIIGIVISVFSVNSFFIYGRPDTDTLYINILTEVTVRSVLLYTIYYLLIDRNQQFIKGILYAFIISLISSSIGWLFIEYPFNASHYPYGELMGLTDEPPPKTEIEFIWNIIKANITWPLWQILFGLTIKLSYKENSNIS